MGEVNAVMTTLSFFVDERTASGISRAAFGEH